MDNLVKFSDLGLSENMLKAIEKKWYTHPSPIQAQVIPLLLNWKKDIIWQAQTWTWKTASFWIPILERITSDSRETKALILAPTRELAIQVAEEIKSFSNGNINIVLLYGWQSITKEMRDLRNSPTIVVWTPWRVKDHLIKKKTLNIDSLEFFVLDEADEMLNIWFREEIEEIMQHTPENKKTLLFSATMPKSIMDLVHTYIKDYDMVAIKKEETTNKNIIQKCYKVPEKHKFEALCRVIEVEDDFYWIIFCRTKSDVDEVASNLMSRWYKVEWIHGDIDQSQREKTLWRFRKKTIKILVATDVAARWIDVSDLTHVLNYSLPDNPETYTHRIWRTWRAGKTWEAISFVSRRDWRVLMYIERIIKSKIEVAKLPDIKDVINFKKKRLVNSIKESLENIDSNDFIDISKKLLELWDAENVISSILKSVYKNEFDEKSYEHVAEEQTSNGSSFSSRWDSYWSRSSVNSNWEQRLFVAKWRLEGLTPWSLIQFLEKETWTKLWDVWKIEVLNEFSFINVWASDAEVILSYFKSKNREKPLVVQAKAKDWSRWWERRWGWSFWRSSFWDRRWGWNFWSRDGWFRRDWEKPAFRKNRLANRWDR